MIQLAVRQRTALERLLLCLICAALAVAGDVAHAANAGAEVLAIRSVTAAPSQVAVYDRLELTVELSGSWVNPFDPDEIALAAHFTRPDGTMQTVPGFFYQDFEERQGRRRAVGNPVWKIRYAPTVAGPHTYIVTAGDRSGTVRSREAAVTVLPAKTRGFIRVSQRAPTYFEHDDGTGYVPVGANFYFRTELNKPIETRRLAEMRRMLDAIAAQGGNFVRLRADSWFLRVEGRKDAASGHQGIGWMHAETAWEIDQLFDLARERGVFIQLTLYNANAIVNDPRFERRAAFNFFDKRNGGPLQSRTDFWTNPDALRLVERRLRYSVARWGYSRNLLAWEFFNEVDLQPDIAAASVAWHERMSSYLRSLDPWRHPITTSVLEKTFRESGALWRLPTIDIVQHHVYSTSDFAGALPEEIHDSVKQYGKPLMIAEFGLPRLVIEKDGHGADRSGRHLHDALWASTFAGAAGAAVHWYLPRYIDQFDLYSRFRGISAVAREMDLLQGNLEEVRVEGLEYRDVPTEERFDTVTLEGSARFERARVSRFEVGPDGRLSDAAELNGYLWGLKAHPGLRNAPTFVVDYPRPGRFIAVIGTVIGKGNNPIRLSIDGSVALERNLPTGAGLGRSSRHLERSGNWRTVYGEPLAIDVPAGRHEITVENLGTDRVTVKYELEGYRAVHAAPPLRVLGLGNKSRAYLWIRNAGTRSSLDPEAIAPSRFRVQGLRDGDYRIEFFDTVTGKPSTSSTARAQNGQLIVPVPAIATDIACIIQLQ